MSDLLPRAATEPRRPVEVLVLGVLCLAALLAPSSPAEAIPYEYVKSVEYVEFSYPGSGSLTKGQVVANCVPFVGTAASGAGNRFIGMTLDVYFSGSSVIASKTNSVGSNTLGVWVVEFDPAYVRVQQGSWSVTPGTSWTAAIASVNLSKAALVFYNHSSNEPLTWRPISIAARFSSATQITFERTATDGISLNSGHWFVFEALNDEFTVQTASLSIGSGQTSGTASIFSVPTDRSFVLGSYRSSVASDAPRAGAVNLYLNSATELKADRSYADASPIDAIQAFVVTLSGAARVQRGTLSYGALSTTATVSQVDTRFAMVLGGMRTPVGGVMLNAADDAGADSYLGSAFHYVKLSNSTTVQGTRGLTGASATGRFEVVEWKRTATGMQVQSGTYVGNGASGRAITGVGFRPDLVIVTSNETWARSTVIRSSTMAGTASKALYYYTNDPLQNRITSLDGDGFTVGHPTAHSGTEDVTRATNSPYHCVNHDGVTYHWTALRAASGEMVLGTYTGTWDGFASPPATQQTINAGITPAYVLVWPATNVDSYGRVWQRSSVMPANTSFDFYGGDWCPAACSYNAAIRSFSGTTFGVENDANRQGTTYHYAVWQSTAGRIAVGSYNTVASPPDNRQITTVGFQPEYVSVTRGTPLMSPGDSTVIKNAATGATNDFTQDAVCWANCPWQDSIQALLSNGFEIGLSSRVQAASQTYYWTAFGPADTVPTSQMLVKSGSYSGNASTSRFVPVGFQPDVVVVKSVSTRAAVVRTSTMNGDTTKPLDSAGGAASLVFVNGIKSLDSGGFTIGQDVKVNNTGETYHWVALKAAPGEMVVGNYTGNGLDSRPINSVGFQPDYVVVMDTGTGVGVSAVQRSSSWAGDQAYTFGSELAGTGPNRIQQLLPDGFEVGSDGTVNNNLRPYQYIAWKATAGRVSVGSYTGDTADPSARDLAGFRPEWVLVKSEAATAWNHKPASTGLAVDSTLYFEPTASAADYVQKLRPLGFEVGASDNAFNVNHHFIAFGPADTSFLALSAATSGCGVAANRTPLEKVSQRKIVRDTNGYRYLVYSKFRNTGSCAGYQETMLARSTDGGRTWVEVKLFGSGGIAWNSATTSFAYPAVDVNPTRNQLHVTVLDSTNLRVLYTRNVSLASWNVGASWTNDSGVAGYRQFTDAVTSDTAPVIAVDADNFPHLAYQWYSAGLGGYVVRYQEQLAAGSWQADTLGTGHAAASLARDASIDFARGADSASVSRDRVHVLYKEDANADGYPDTLRHAFFQRVAAGTPWTKTDRTIAQFFMRNAVTNYARGMSLVASGAQVWAVGAFDNGVNSWLTKSAYSCDNGDRWGDSGDACGNGYSGGSAASAVLSTEAYPAAGYSIPDTGHRVAGAARATASTVLGYRWQPRDGLFKYRTTLQSDGVAGQLTDSPNFSLEKERPTGSADFAYCWYVSEGTSPSMTVDEIRCNVEPTIVYRSIGFGAKVDEGGTLDANTGERTFYGASTLWKSNRWGRGDRIRVSGQDYVVDRVITDTELQVTSPFLGSGAAGSLSYTMSRQYTGTTAALSSWESCISGAASCTHFPVESASLVGDNRIEVGIVYDDGAQHTGTLAIDGSTTDWLHSITLTVAADSRHDGVGGGGATVNVSGTPATPAIDVLDPGVTVEWLEFRGSGAGGAGIRVNTTDSAFANPITLRNNLIQPSGGNGISVGTTESQSILLDVHNNMTKPTSSATLANPAYQLNLAPSGSSWNPSSEVYVSNNTFYGRSNFAYTSGVRATPASNTALTLVNNIAVAFSGTSASSFSVPSPSSATGYNLSSDATAPGSNARLNVTVGSGGVNFVDTSTPNLHLLGDSTQALNTGTALASPYALDIDGQTRSGTWDIGADEYNGTTAVKLAAFRAAGLDAAVAVEWETAQELDNLGFHLYRGTSPDGPWALLNATMIPGLGSSPEGKLYRHVDSGLVNGTTYFYRLEDVDRHGSVTSHGPVSATPQVGGQAGGGGGGGGGGGEGGGGGGTEEPPPSPKTKPRASWKPHGDPETQSLRVLERSPSGVTLELVTGGFYSEEQADGTSKLIVPGFFDRSEPGRPTVPTRRLWQDALVGRGVKLVSVTPSELVSFSGLSVPLAGKPVAVATQGGTYEASALPVSPAEARRARAKDATSAGTPFPASFARVHQTAFQGERKKAYVELAPLRVNETTGRVVLARRLLVRLAFTGTVDGEHGKGSIGRRAPVPVAADTAADSAPQVLARLATRTRGLHAVAFSAIPGLTGPVATSSLRLSRLGASVPFHVEPRTASFGPGSTLYFFSDGTDSAYANEAVYELSVGAGGLPMPVAVASARRVSTTTPLTTLRHEGSFEADLNYLPALTEARDVWVWDAGLAGSQGQDYGFTTYAPALVAETARLRVDLEGGSDTLVEPDHHVLAFVNGSLVGELRFDGMRPATLEADVPTPLLRDGANTLRLENAGDTGSTASFVYLDRFSLEYPRPLTPTAGVLEGKASQAGRASLEAAPGSILLDTTGSTPVFLGRALAGGRLAWNAEVSHRYLAVFPEALLEPEVGPAPATSLRDTTNQADWIVIAPEVLLPAAEDLAAHREAQGLSALAVSLEAVVDEFGFGEAGPHAVRDFLAFAFHRWQSPSPRYVLLLGDASYDPKGHLVGTSRPDLIPSLFTKSTFLWTPADPLFAAVNGTDSLPDIAIGRINAATLAEAQVAIQKILDFENAGLSLAGKATLVADNPDQAGDFEANQDEIATLLPSRPVDKLFLTQLGTTATKAAVRSAFDSGLSLMSYVGHGSSGLWATEGILRSPDIAAFAPQPQQPLVLTMTCSNGYFVSPYNNSLSERLVLAEQKGAIASFSPSGLSLNDAAHVYHRAVVSELELGAHDRLGDLLLAAQASYAASGAFPELLDFYNLLGDPGLRVR